MYQEQSINAPISKKPVDAFNVLKALVMLFLPLVHIVESYDELEAIPESLTALTDVIISLTAFGPAIFMICMGIGFTHQVSCQRARKTGIQVVILNVLRNFFIFVLPYFLMWLAGEEEFCYVIDGFFESDIYFFVGLFYIFYSLMMRHRVSSKTIFIISLGMLVLSIVLNNCLDWEYSLLSTFMGNFITGPEVAYFPFIAMAIYPCIGILLREKVLGLETAKRNRVFGWIFGASALCLIGIAVAASVMETSLVELICNISWEGEFGVMEVGANLSAALLILSAFYFLFTFIKENPFEKFLLRISPLLFPFYMVQWILVGLVSYIPYSIALVFFETEIILSIPLLVILFVAIEALSLWIVLTKGFTLSRWMLKISDYTRWFRSKTPKKA